MDAAIKAHTLELMRAGYIALGKQQRCTVCGGQLFKNKTNAEDIVCVACDVRATQPETPEPPQTSVEAPASTSTHAETTESAEAGSPYNTTCDRDEACHRLGELLLQHWRMLAEECPNGCRVPLMQHLRGEQGYCVACLAHVPLEHD